MKHFIYLFLFLTLNSSLAQEKLAIVQIPYWNENVKIDGDLSDWKEVLALTFEDTLSILHSGAQLEKFSDYPGKESFDLSTIKKPLSKNKVFIQSYWNFQNLYFAFTVFDNHLFGEISNAHNNPNIYLNDGIEIYLDTRNDSPIEMDLNDYQFSVDVFNNTVVFRGDRKLMADDTLGVPKDFGQNVLFESAVFVYGDINDTESIDSVYVVELAIPFAAIGIQPQTGMKMKLDLCNNDIDYSFSSAKTLTDTLLIYWPFNWTGASDFGYPYLWKQVELVGKPGLLEEINNKFSKYWIFIFTVTLILSFLVVLFLFIRITRLKKMPHINEISPAKIVFLKGRHMDDPPLSANQKLLQKATDFIIQNKSIQLNSEEVAKHAAISLRNFQRITRDELNCTPTNFVYLVKLNLAADYLVQKQGNVTEAAYEFGFSDSSYFSKIFKNHFGVAPSEYRVE